MFEMKSGIRSLVLVFSLALTACSDVGLPTAEDQQGTSATVNHTGPSAIILDPVIVKVPQCDPYTDLNFCQGSGGDCMTSTSPDEMTLSGCGGPGGSTGGSGSTGSTPPASAPEGIDQAYYEDLNDQERKLCWQNPGECWNVKGASNYASVWAAQEEANGAHNGPQDALRHAMWNARMTQLMGFERAKAWADAHESTSNDEAETRMDLHNNAAGRDIGRFYSDIEVGVRDYRTTGQLCLNVGSC